MKAQSKRASQFDQEGHLMLLMEMWEMELSSVRVSQLSWQVVCLYVCVWRWWMWWTSARPSVPPLVNEAFMEMKWGCRRVGWRLELVAAVRTVRGGAAQEHRCGKQDFKMLIGWCQPHLQPLFGWYRQSCEACTEPLSDFSISGRPSGTARHYCAPQQPPTPPATQPWSSRCLSGCMAARSLQWSALVKLFKSMKNTCQTLVLIVQQLCEHNMMVLMLFFPPW